MTFFFSILWTKNLDRNSLQGLKILRENFTRTKNFDGKFYKT